MEHPARRLLLGGGSDAHHTGDRRPGTLADPEVLDIGSVGAAREVDLPEENWIGGIQSRGHSSPRRNDLRGNGRLARPDRISRSVPRVKSL
jgi:hypothetical protein